MKKNSEPGDDGLFDDCELCRMMRRGQNGPADMLEALAIEKRKGGTVYVAPNFWDMVGSGGDGEVVQIVMRYPDEESPRDQKPEQPE